MENNPAIRAVIYGNETLHIHSDGCISRPALKMSPSGQWKIRGAVERNNFGIAIRRYTLADILDHGDKLPWTFKNGKQRIFMQDFDHGALREWVSPRHRVSYRLEKGE